MEHPNLILRTKNVCSGLPHVSFLQEHTNPSPFPAVKECHCTETPKLSSNFHRCIQLKKLDVQSECKVTETQEFLNVQILAGLWQHTEGLSMLGMYVKEISGHSEKGSGADRWVTEMRWTGHLKSTAGRKGPRFSAPYNQWYVCCFCLFSRRRWKLRF